MTGPPGKAQMSHRDRRHAQAAGARHRWLNRLQTALLVLTLLGIAAVAGSGVHPAARTGSGFRADPATVWRTPSAPE